MPINMHSRTPSAPAVAAPVIAAERWARRLLLALVVVFPLCWVTPDATLNTPGDLWRRVALLAGAGLLTALVVLGWTQRRTLTLRRHGLDLAVLLFFLTACLSGLLGEYPRFSLLSPIWAQDFTTLLAIKVGVLLYFCVKEFTRDEQQVETLAAALVGVGGVVALIGLLDFCFHLGLSAEFSGRRLTATLDSPMFAGTFLAMLIPLGIGVALATTCRVRRGLAITGTALMGLALLLTQSRASWVGLALTVLRWASTCCGCARPGPPARGSPHSASWWRCRYSACAFRRCARACKPWPNRRPPRANSARSTCRAH